MAQEDLSQLKIDKTPVAARPARRRSMRYWLAGAVLAAVLFILYFSGVLRPAAEVRVVSVQRTYPSQTFTLLNASGYVVAQRKAAVASKATGRLVWLGVEEGSRVRKGDVLARLENDDVTAQQAQAEANLRNARTVREQARAELRDAELSFRRIRSLLSEGIVARADFDSAEARYRKATAALAGSEAGIGASAAALDAARVAVEYTLIRAPFDAVVLTKDADVGDIVTPLGAAANAKAAVVTIADMGSLQVEVDVSESNLGQVREGGPCEIQLDAIPDIRFRGVVHMIVPTADRSKATVMVKVRFLDTDRRILPEMSAKVAILSRPVGAADRQPRTTVNPAAVVERGGRKVVFLVKDDRVKEVPVTLGSRSGDLVEVVSGVKAGDRVVSAPGENLRDGSRIQITEK
jgi:RND family efflux transporter MFP subunit